MRGIRETIGGALSAISVDVFAFGGSTIIAIVTILLETIELWVPMLSYLTTVSERVPWLSASMFDTLLLIGMSILIVTYAVRIIRRGRKTITNDTNET